MGFTMTRKAKRVAKLPTIRISRDGFFYACTLEQVPNDSIDIDRPIVCPCCERGVYIATETQEHGKFESKFTLLFACIPCLKAWLYNYTLPAYELPEAEEANNA